MKDNSLIRGRYNAGQYIIAGDEPCAESLRNWIITHGYKQYEQPGFRFDRHGRARNKLYGFQLPEAKCEVVMKMCRVLLSDCRWPQRLELTVKQYIKDYNKTAFLGCRMMHLAGMPVARPLAFWNARRGLLDRASYFLYEKIPGCSLQEWCETLQRSGHENTDSLLEAAKCKAMRIVRTMHDAGLRHNDPHGQNFLVDIPPPTPHLSPTDIEQATYRLIDYDHCTQAFVRIPAIKQFFDLIEFRRGACIGGAGPHQLLDIYLDRQPSSFAHKALEFWCRGGFNPWRWMLVSHKKKHNRRLKA